MEKTLIIKFDPDGGRITFEAPTADDIPTGIDAVNIMAHLAAFTANAIVRDGGDPIIGLRDLLVNVTKLSAEILADDEKDDEKDDDSVPGILQ